MTTKDLFSFNNYNGTAGYVNRPASKQRALDDQASGVLSVRAEQVLDLLLKAGRGGMIWKELGDALEIHHGQISGLLTNMHRKKLIYSVRHIRDRCHPYIHAGFVGHYDEKELFLVPTKVVQTANNQTVKVLLEAIMRCQNENYNLYSVKALNELYTEINNQINNERE